MKIIITTDNETIELGKIFIESFIRNKKSSANGELTFEMLISGEAGITKGVNLIFCKQLLLGKEFSLQCLTSLNSIDLPEAVLSEKILLNVCAYGYYNSGATNEGCLRCHYSW